MKLIKIIIPIFLILSLRININSEELKHDRIENLNIKLNQRINFGQMINLFGIDSNSRIFYQFSNTRNFVGISKRINDKLMIDYYIFFDDKDTIFMKTPYFYDSLKNIKKELLIEINKIKSDEIKCVFADSLYESYFSK